MKLAERFQMSVENIYSLNLSRTTKKANAAFCGIGKTKRIILADTLIEKFNEDEIETVLAHELGHFKHKDVWKQLGFGMVLSFFGFGIVGYVVHARVGLFGTQGVNDILVFPFLCLVFYIL